MGKCKESRYTDFTPEHKLIIQCRELQKQGKTFSNRILEAVDLNRRGAAMTHIVKFRKNFNAFADDVAYLVVIDYFMSLLSHEDTDVKKVKRLNHLLPANLKTSGG